MTMLVGFVYAREEANMHAFMSTKECIALLFGQICLEGTTLMVRVCGESRNQNPCCEDCGEKRGECSV